MNASLRNSCSACGKISVNYTMNCCSVVACVPVLKNAQKSRSRTANCCIQKKRSGLMTSFEESNENCTHLCNLPPLKI